MENDNMAEEDGDHLAYPKMLDDEIDVIFEQIRGVINSKELDSTDRLRLLIMMIAEVVVSIQCRDCREHAQNFIGRYLACCLYDAMKTPITGESVHRH
jgi:hypothetical protein